MAKYNVTFSCGHEGVVELFGKDTDRKKKIEYFENNGLCNKCYKEKMEETVKASGLIFNASILPRVALSDGSYLLNVWFSGDTMPHKDDIKALGYKWGEIGTTQNMLEITRPSMFWNKVIKVDELVSEIEAAKELGATKFYTEKNFWNAIDYRMAISAKKEWEEKHERLQNIPKPEVPAKIKGCKWNQKIYGKAGSYTIYPNGEKTVITDEEAAEIKLYLKQNAEYLEKVKEITS